MQRIPRRRRETANETGGLIIARLGETERERELWIGRALRAEAALAAAREERDGYKEYWCRFATWAQAELNPGRWAGYPLDDAVHVEWTESRAALATAEAALAAALRRAEVAELDTARLDKAEELLAARWDAISLPDGTVLLAGRTEEIERPTFRAALDACEARPAPREGGQG